MNSLSSIHSKEVKTKQTFQYGNKIIEYILIQSKRRKTCEVIVDKEEIVIRSPFDMPIKEIEQILNDKIKSLYEKWLFSKDNHKIFHEKVTHFSKIVDVKPKRIVIKNLKNRWGSITKNNTINLNVNLLKAPEDIIDYIVIHELCHLKIKGHSY